MKATVIWREVVLWDTPGGNHHKAFLHIGDEIEVLDGWDYGSRTWKDKRFLKATAKGKIGYILASAITPPRRGRHATDNKTQDRPENKESRHLENNTVNGG